MDKIIKYKVTKYRLNSIEAQEIERETDKSVWYSHEGYNGKLHERRELKISDYCSWFDTFQEAKAYVIKKRENKIERLRRDLTEANTALFEAKNLEEGK